MSYRRQKRQTHLGHRNSTKTLTIIDVLPPPHHSDEPLCICNNPTSNTTPKKSYILNLPDELLLPIVELVCTPRGQDYPTYQRASMYDNGGIRVLSSICKRMKRLAQPFLFKEIVIESPHALVRPSIKVIKLHRTLERRRDLREFCRALYVYIPDNNSRDPNPGSYSIALDLADWLRKTRILSIHGGFTTVDEESKMGNERTWALLRRMTASFTDLEQISISREGWNLYLAPIFKWLAFPNLKSLKVFGISGWKEHGDVELEAEKLRTASFTSLHVSDYEETPQATHLLLQWPAKLTEFDFGSFYNNPHIMDYPMFESWLYIHRDTLTHISIGYLSRHGSTQLFNATLFPNLAYLKLSRWQMEPHVDFSGYSPQDGKILGPALTTFAWDFSIYDQHSEGWCDFGDAEVNWVRGLAATAVARKAPLKKIEIKFTPDTCWGTTEEMEYPWDRMDALRDVHLKPKGFELVYNEPSISKDKWLKYVRTGIFQGWHDDGTQVVDSGAGEGQDGSGRESEDDDEKVEGSLDDDISCGYQGEDIRKYFAKEAKRV